MHCKEVQKEAEVKVGNAEFECQKKKKELEEKIEMAQRQEKAAWELEAKLDEKITEESERISRSERKRLQKDYENKQKHLKTKYKSMVVNHEILLNGSLLYGILCSLLYAVRSKTLVSDFKAFFIGIGGILLKLIKNCENGANSVAKISDKIQNAIVQDIVYWVIWIVVVVVIVLGIGYGLYWTGRKYILWYKKKYMDYISVMVALISMAITIFFAKEIKAILPINLIFLNLIIHLLYSILRNYVVSEK